MRLPDRDCTTTLRGWGRVRTSRSAFVRLEEGTSASDAVHHATGGVIARGLGRAYGDAATLEGGTVMDARPLRALGPVTALGREATIEAGGGVSLGEIVDVTAPLGWLRRVLPGTRHVTVGGAIAADVHGKNHHRDGGFGRYVESVQLLTADGSIRQVTRETDQPLFEATVGGMGLTGVVLSARFRLGPLPTPYLMVGSLQTSDLDDTMQRLTEGDQRYPYSVAWLDLATPGRRSRGVVQSATAARPRDVEVFGRRRGERRWTFPAPPLPSGGLIQTPVIQAFNTYYWMRPRRSPDLSTLDSFVHPLDRLSDWPRLYGRAGLYQYQFVVPAGAEAALRRIIERITSGPVTPALAVLKRLGPEGEGMLSFPLEGWTLAVDLPAAFGDVGALMDSLDTLVVEAGGRVYLAKDARLRPEHMAAMYPRLDEWREQKERIDPAHRFRSDLAERLGLVRPRDVR